MATTRKHAAAERQGVQEPIPPHTKGAGEVISGRTSYVFGPVPSRRLGRSLGVDIVPFKTCCYDCIYCQLGRTPKTTIARRRYVPIDAVLAEVGGRLDTGPDVDYLTVTGSGEPTLHKGIGPLIKRLKALSPVPVAVLTNGALLGRPDVRDALAEADLVLPSLDAGEPALFHQVNRPHPSVGFGRVVDGLQSFRAHFQNQMWLEVFLLNGFTSCIADVERIAYLCRQIAPDRIQLNTVARPPAEGTAGAVPYDVLSDLARLFDAPTEVIAPRNEDRALPGLHAGISDEMLALLRRRPCTVKDLSLATGENPSVVVKALTRLSTQGDIRASSLNDTRFYAATSWQEPE